MQLSAPNTSCNPETPSSQLPKNSTPSLVSYLFSPFTASSAVTNTNSNTVAFIKPPFSSTFFADDLTAALQACGQQTDLLQVGQQICLPGADKPGCANVKSYNGNNNCKVYVVQQGDTIESVAGSLQIYRNDLDNLNKDVQSNGLLQPNKYLKLPPWSNSCGDPNKSGESCRLYIVNQGDFIAGIAAAYSVSVDDVLAVNPGLTADSVLQQSQPIKIPPFPASCGAGTPSKPPTDTVLKCRGYRVQQGEDINKIAQYVRLAHFLCLVYILYNIHKEMNRFP